MGKELRRMKEERIKEIQKKEEVIENISRESFQLI
jgi:hypothetical protein